MIHEIILDRRNKAFFIQENGTSWNDLVTPDVREWMEENVGQAFSTNYFGWMQNGLPRLEPGQWDILNAIVVGSNDLNKVVLRMNCTDAVAVQFALRWL